DTLRALEEALVSFAGCAVVISHDRWFLDRIATHMLAFEGDSEVVWFEGNYQDYEADRHRLPDLQRPGVGPLLPGDHPEERRLAGAVRADHADDAAARQREVEIVHQQVVAVAFPQLPRFDDDIA